MIHVFTETFLEIKYLKNKLNENKLIVLNRGLKFFICILSQVFFYMNPSIARESGWGNLLLYFLLQLLLHCGLLVILEVARY